MSTLISSSKNHIYLFMLYTNAESLLNIHETYSKRMTSTTYCSWRNIWELCPCIIEILLNGSHITVLEITD